MPTVTGAMADPTDAAQSGDSAKQDHRRTRWLDEGETKGEESEEQNRLDSELARLTGEARTR